MLNIKAFAEVKSIVLRKEFVGEEREPAVTVKLAYKGLPLEVVRDAFISQLELAFDAAGLPRLTGIKPLELDHDIRNVSCTIARGEFRANVTDVAIALQPGEKCDVTLKCSGRVGDLAVDVLHEALFDSVATELIEIPPGEELKSQAA